jgi:hypothetical protein
MKMAPAATNTRQSSVCPILGKPAELPQNVLPTCYDVMKYCLLLQKRVKENNNGKNPSIKVVIETCTTNIEKLWIRASIPTVSHRRIVQMIRDRYEKYKNLLKSYHRRHQETYKTRLDEFSNSTEKLFDIASCKCSDFLACQCSKSQKVPPAEQVFLIDQRGNRNMYIGGIDTPATKAIKKRELRKAQAEARINTEATTSSKSSPISKTDISTSSHDLEKDDPSPSVKKRKMSENQTRVELPTLALTCDRYGVSDRAGAAIASAVLKDVGIVTETNRDKVIDRSKLRRERKRKRQSLLDGKQPHNLHGLFFDGRRDRTLFNDWDGINYHRKTVTEEHYCLVGEPGSHYLGHVSPCSGSAKNIEEAIGSFLLQKNINLDSFCAIGCDATVTNTGRTGGIISLLEKRINKSLQWIICLLHVNELPLRHLFKKLDGTTSAPNAFSGPVGKALENCEKKPVIDFQKIDGYLPNVTAMDLSTDQKYLFEITTAVLNGQCSESLSLRDPGKMAHSRWLTTANRILRLYIASENPCSQLKTLAEFVIKVYAPMWFEIKTNPYFCYGARHLWKLVALTRYLPEELKTVVDAVIQRNAYFAHPENLLLSMITDDIPTVRKLGYKRIMKARVENHSDIRKFEIPKLNFEAHSYIDLIDWQKNAITEPPVLCFMETEEIQKYIELPDSPAYNALQIPCHSQAVERCVKLVSEASSNVCGSADREGFIKSRLESRRIMPTFNTKADFLTEET